MSDYSGFTPREFYYDVIVIGGGHAGCEAALAAARVLSAKSGGGSVALFAMSVESIAQMPCNPAIGGTSKGHLVREVDALGGAMAKCIDKTYIQSRMLNLSKGPAVHSLRAQADKEAYRAEMLRTLRGCELLDVIQSEIVDILTDDEGKVTGALSAHGIAYGAKAVVICAGTYMNARCLTGEAISLTGPNGQKRSELLTAALRGLNIKTRRFKTGTPARVLTRSINFSACEPQYGDDPPTPFSFENTAEEIVRAQVPCHLTYTTEATREIIFKNLSRSPMYSGIIEGAGARYCPSIEDKAVRFKDKPKHQVFLEPEGEGGEETYIQGVSTSLPADVQVDMYRSIEGLESARITRFGYAIEYDVIDSAALSQTLGVKSVPGLYCAGQVNGTSGYEEAAAQGLFAGANAALFALNLPGFTLSRSQAYIGVMIDDLVTKGVSEPYRMMTARAEYRLILRQDNADTRLYEIAYENGLIPRPRYEAVSRKKQLVEEEIARLEKSGEARDIRRPENSFSAGARQGLPRDVIEQVNIQIKYDGYIKKQLRQIAEFQRVESRIVPYNINYEDVPNIRIEAREKLMAAMPENVGRASRLPGVSPADVSALLIYLRSIEVRSIEERV